MSTGSNKNKTYAVVVKNGQAKLYENNVLYRYIGKDKTTNAVVQGDEVHITEKDGCLKIYTLSGVLKRIIS